MTATATAAPLVELKLRLIDSTHRPQLSQSYRGTLTGSAVGAHRGHADVKLNTSVHDELVPLRADVTFEVVSDLFIRLHRSLCKRRAVNVLPKEFSRRWDDKSLRTGVNPHTSETGIFEQVAQLARIMH